MIEGIVAVIYPPSEQQFVLNVLTEGVSEKLSKNLKELFGRWPSNN